ncbi:sulfur-oxidizing protein SoxY [Natronocella acetinitrilica]|uniref:Sulfur-oxidizing protein SoxY n=1 Tax=Natronocella acetinitrilica TaxID=414046 RepID=A0AAE3G521_9GAMM|nr:thiosulfate oxidation carrier complex protein SoxZ [Natronocella acetinitrilica]MCP1675278.1 sulfur-oxidizing protein SoxY [Natronocella acetinitrilica]
MRETNSLSLAVSRRKILSLAGMGLAGLALAAWSPMSLAQSAPWTRHDAITNLLDGREPETSGVTLELPSVSEDGSSIPLTVSVDSPMSDDDYVESVYLFAPDNPNPQIAAFHFTPQSGRARVSTRIRLNESQRVFAVAKLSNGDMRIAHQEARVTVSGCLMDDSTYDSSGLMQARVRVPGSVRSGEAAEVLTMINHPMETGFREGSDGETLPRHIVQSFVMEMDGETVFRVELHPSLSANPYLRFHVKPRSSGTVTMTWEDDQGETTREEASINVS